jgi:hypothetical protein
MTRFTIVLIADTEHRRLRGGVNVHCDCGRVAAPRERAPGMLWLLVLARVNGRGTAIATTREPLRFLKRVAPPPLGSAPCRVPLVLRVRPLRQLPLDAAAYADLFSSPRDVWFEQPAVPFSGSSGARPRGSARRSARRRGGS